MHADLTRRSHGHLLQFFNAEEFLFDAVGTFIADGVLAGEPVIVIATDEHRRGFLAGAAAKGIDPNRVTFIDAQELLGRFMDGAMPDEQRLLTIAGGFLDEATSASPRGHIRVYGEMVALLWLDGKREAAVRLEELWNELAALYRFTLLCAYPMDLFQTESDIPLFDRVCDAHGRVFPAESYSRAAGDDTRLREIASLQQRASALEAESARRRELERQAIRTHDEFLSTLSHELRTPLTSILGWSRLLLLGSLDENTSRLAVETIERSAQSQAVLIDELLDLSRVMNGRLALRREPVDLVTAVSNATETLRLAADARRITIVVDAEPCTVAGDAKRVQQVAWHLLSNAVKFSEFGGEVSVTVGCDGDSAKLTVRDRGHGIETRFLPHVFETFRQADGAATRTHNGLGLGLATVKYLVEMHGGTVTAASDGLGTGATFAVTLPLARA